MNKLIKLLIPLLFFGSGLLYGQITGPTTMCAGSTVTLHDSTPSGYWLTSTTSIDSVGYSTGVVTAYSAGTATISYIVGTTVMATHTITVYPVPGPIAGPSTVCSGSTILVTDPSPGGTWSSSSMTIATVGATGMVTGIAPGTAVILYSLPSGCSTSFPVFVGAGGTAGVISGDSTMCTGTSSTFTSSVSGGVWTSSNAAVLTISPSSGLATPVAAGTATVTYTISSSCGTYASTYLVTVGYSPAPASGPTSVCSGALATFTDATPGGWWASSSSSVAPISTSGVVTGGTPGTATIYYYGSGSCFASASITVLPGGTAGIITGDSAICIGTSATFLSTIPGGLWTSSNPAVATVDTTGLVHGVSVGSTVISYSTYGSCGFSYATYSVTIMSAGSAGTISGSSTLIAGTSMTLFETVGSGTWSSSSTAVATIGAATGVVTGISAGTTTISYVVAGCSGGPYIATFNVNVIPVNRISGTIHFGSTPIDSSGVLKVWLITYNSSTMDLEAADSIVTTAAGTTYNYQFLSAVSDSYRVKAAYFPAAFSPTGYVPTYHISNPHWSTSDAFYHTYGTTDDFMDIIMMYGTATSGPGFIGGNIVTGANKGTTGTVPAANILVFLINTGTGALIQHTYTNSSGLYSFSNLPVNNSYMVFPEALNYETIPITGISLTASIPSYTMANFVQHTISKTITPNELLGIQNVSSTPALVAFPNPCAGKLNIHWSGNHSGSASVVIANIAGQELYTGTIDLSQANGVAGIDCSNMANGMYILTVKGTDVNYVSKIDIAH